MTVEMMPSAREIALANVVVDIEKGAARVGWDHAPSIYALVPTAMLLADPNLPPTSPSSCARAGMGPRTT